MVGLLIIFWDLFSSGIIFCYSGCS